MKNTFSLHRFGLLLRHHTMSDFKRHLRGPIGLYFGLLVIYLMVYYEPSTKGLRGGMTEFELTNMATGITLLVAFCSFFVYMASCFAGLHTRQKRTAFLILPATTMEKYLSCTLFAFLNWFVALNLAVVCADLTRLALFPLMGHGFESILPSFYSAPYDFVNLVLAATEGEFIDFPVQIISVTIVVSVFAMVFFILVSAAFRRYAIFIGLLLLQGLQMLVGMPLRALFGNTDTVLTIWIVLYSLLTFVVLWWSYRMFSRIEVIRHKFLPL